MNYAYLSTLYGARGRMHDDRLAHRQPSKATTRFGRKMAYLVSSAFLAGFAVSLFGIAPGNTVHASDRITILDFICETYESARQVALEQSWDHPEGMPSDCRTLFKRGNEERAAKILQIIEIVPIGNGRLVEIGRVHLGSVEKGYSAGTVHSAGTTDQLHLF